MATSTVPRLLPVEELFADPLFSGASLSADGARLAYLAPRYGRTQVWVRGVDEEHQGAVCVTHDRERGIKTYFWTDDPRWLLYLQDTGGNEDWHLFRVDLENPDAPAVDLTPMAPGARVMSVEPSRGTPGTVLVTMNRRPMFFDAFRVVVATGATTLEAEQPALRSMLMGVDGQTFFAVATREDGTIDVFAQDGSGPDAARRLLLSLPGADHPLGVWPCQSTPDGSALLVGIYPPGSDDIALVIVDRASGEQTVVAARPGSSVCEMGYHGPRWAPALVTDRATGDVLAVRFTGERPVVVPVDDRFAEVLHSVLGLSAGVLGSVSSDREGRRWVVSFIDDVRPGLTYLYDHDTGGSRLLFDPYPQLDAAGLAPMTPLTVPARDGLPLPCFLTLPVGVDPVGLPLVLKVHGGPWSHDSWTFDRDVQLLANRGYAVLQVNFRGSTGYGRRHVHAGIGEWAGKMHDDLVDAADWTVAQGWVDPARIAIFGGSYGGYAALVGVTFTPDYFAAAVDYVGISNLATFMESLPEFTRPDHVNNFYLHIGDPTDPAQLPTVLARSPITHVDRITTPLMVVQGANDVRVVQTEADRIVDALRARGVEVEYLLAQDEGHGFQNPENVVAMFTAMERFLGEHLGGRVDR